MFWAFRIGGISSVYGDPVEREHWFRRGARIVFAMRVGAPAVVGVALGWRVWYYRISSSLLLKSEPEFHAEWLRDGPCDATTTGLSNSGHRCQLSLTLSGGEHEIRGACCIAL